VPEASVAGEEVAAHLRSGCLPSSISLSGLSTGVLFPESSSVDLLSEQDHFEEWEVF